MRISTTTLESFRLFMQPEQDWMSEEDLLATIRGEFHPTKEIAIGQAFGRILESPTPYKIGGGYCVKDRVFGDILLGDDVVGPALELIDRPRTVFEAKGVGRYLGHDIVAKADQMRGGDLSETKTTFSNFQLEKYLDSYQWRFMSDMFQVPRVTYQVFCLSEGSTGVIALKDVEIVPVYAYPGLHGDCDELVRAFAAYIDVRDRGGLGLRAFLDAREAALAGGLL
jgi:hypothetical protein